MSDEQPKPVQTSPRIPLFLDCDPGIDDAVALGYLFCQDDVDIVGIAASGGNVSTDQVVRNTLGWLELAGRTDLPVHAGAEHPLAGESESSQEAQSSQENQLPQETPLPPETGFSPEVQYAEETHGDTGAGYARLPSPGPHSMLSKTSAAQAWADAARRHPGELIGVVTGPCTNLALALELEPELPQLLRRLFIMGGAFNYRGNTRPTTEWNITYDPESADRVLRAFAETPGPAHLPVIGPIEATEAVALTPDRLERITSAETSPRWKDFMDQLAEALRFYFEFHDADGHGYLAHIHDPYVLAAALEWARNSPADPEPGIIPWAETATAPVGVELTGTLTRGETVADWLGRWGREPNAEIIRSIDAETFLSHLTESLMRGPR